MHWFLDVLKNRYATFTGRARRAEYWYFFLVYLLIYAGLAIVDSVIGLFSWEGGVGLLSTLFSLAMLIPSIAVAVRRLHDIDRSGWWVLIGLIPFIGGLVLLIFMCLKGTSGANRFGPDPLATL